MKALIVVSDWMHRDCITRQIANFMPGAQIEALGTEQDVMGLNTTVRDILVLNAAVEPLEGCCWGDAGARILETLFNSHIINRQTWVYLRPLMPHDSQRLKEVCKRLGLANIHFGSSAKTEHDYHEFQRFIAEVGQTTAQTRL